MLSKQQLLIGGYRGQGTLNSIRKAFDLGFISNREWLNRRRLEKEARSAFNSRKAHERRLDRQANAYNKQQYNKYLTKLKTSGYKLSTGQQQDYTKLNPVAQKQPVGTYNPKTGVLMTKAGGVSTAFPNGQPKAKTDSNNLNWVKGSALKGYAQTFQNYSKLQPTSYATQSKAFTIPSNVKNSFILNQLYQQAKTQAQRDQVNNITNYQSNIKRFTPTPQILTANQAIRQANVVVQAAKTASISRKYVQPTISGVGKGKKISQTEREKFIETGTTPYLTTLIGQPTIPAIREEINKISNSIAKTITVALKSGRKISYPVFTTIDKAGRSFVQVGITIGDVILSKLSAKDKQYLFKQIFERNTSGSKALKKLFKTVITKQTTKKEVEAKLRALGGTAAQILAVTAVGGATGTLLRGLSMATSDDPTEILASLAMGGVFGGGGVIFEKGSRLVKAYLGTSKLGKVYLFAKVSSGRIIPLYFAYETIGSVGSVLSATSVAGERAVGRRLAGSFAAFGAGTKAGEKIATKLTTPTQNAIWVMLFKKKLIKEYGKNSKEYKQGMQEVQAIFGSMKRANQVLSPYDARFVESVSQSPKAWKIVNKVLRENAGDFAILGSGTIVPQTGLKRPPRGKLGDIDANSLTGSKGARKIALQMYNELIKGGFTKKQVRFSESMFSGEPKYHVSFSKTGKWSKKKSEWPELLNIASSTKTTKYQLDQVSSFFDFPSKVVFNKDKFGIHLLNLRDQMRSKVKGYVEGNRPKDLVDILGLSKTVIVKLNKIPSAKKLEIAFVKSKSPIKKKEILKQLEKIVEKVKKSLTKTSVTKTKSVTQLMSDAKKVKNIAKTTTYKIPNIPKGETVTLYHGTSQANYKKIIKQGFLKKIDEGYAKGVSLTKSAKLATGFAKLKATGIESRKFGWEKIKKVGSTKKGTDAVILKVKVTKAELKKIGDVQDNEVLFLADIPKSRISVLGETKAIKFKVPVKKTKLVSTTKPKLYSSKPKAKIGYTIYKVKYKSGRIKGYRQRPTKYKPSAKTIAIKTKVNTSKVYKYKPSAKKGYIIVKIKYASGKTKGYKYKKSSYSTSKYKPTKYKTSKYKKPKYKKPKYKKPKYKKPKYKKPPYKPPIKKPPYKPPVKKPPYKPPVKRPPYKPPIKPPYKPPYTPPKPPIKPPLKPPVFLPSQSFQQNINRFSKNKRPVNLYIRKRVNGKLKSVLIKRNLFPKQATALGRHITNTTIARTYIIKPSKKGKPRKIRVPRSVNTKRYRNPKGKTQLQLGSRVERSKFLLDTKKEKQQIKTAKRRTPKRIIKRKVKKTVRTVKKRKKSKKKK